MNAPINKDLRKKLILLALAVVISAAGIWSFSFSEYTLDNHELADDLLDRLNALGDEDIEIVIKSTANIDNYRMLLFEQTAPAAANPRLGYALYAQNEITNKYQYKHYGVGTNIQDGIFLRTDSGEYLIVYGVNSNQANKIEINIFDALLKEQVSGDYFVVSFAIKEHSKDNMITELSLISDTETLVLPLIVTSLIR